MTALHFEIWMDFAIIKSALILAVCMSNQGTSLDANCTLCFVFELQNYPNICSICSINVWVGACI